MSAPAHARIAYRRRASPLHAARATVVGAYCAAIALAALLTEHPLLLGSLLATVLAAGAAAGNGPQLLRALRRTALPLPDPQRGRQPARQPPGPDGVREARRLGRARDR